MPSDRVLAYAFGTTVVSLVTTQAIVLAVDSKKDGQGASSANAVKLALLQGRLAAASAWLQTIKGVSVHDALTGESHVFDYDFEVWIRSIEERLPTDMTVSGLAEIIERESASTFKNYDMLIKAGRLRKEQSMADVLVRYYIAGYEGATASIYTVEIQIDWQANELIGPRVELVHSQRASHLDLCFNAGGTHDAIDKVLNRAGEPYDKARARIPDEIEKLLAGESLTLEQAVRLSVALIRIESESNPRTVGLPVRVVTIPRVGVGTVAVYE